MYLKINGGDFSSHIYSEIEAITDQAKLKPENISFDKDENVMSIPIIRHRLSSKVRPFETILKNAFQYKRDYKNGIHTIVKIGKVQDYDIKDYTKEHQIDSIVLLLGIKVRNQDIYLSSAQEDKGIQLFEATIKVEWLELEIKDI